MIKIDNFFFLVDFVVIDTEPVPNPKSQIPVILGHPFLATANANINCRTGIMKISFGHMKVKLNIFNPTLNCMDKHEDAYVVEKCFENEFDKNESLLNVKTSNGLSSKMISKDVVSKSSVEQIWKPKSFVNKGPLISFESNPTSSFGNSLLGGIQSSIQPIKEGMHTKIFDPG